ncbi:hypothetical protein L1D14_07420 [Vibrio tubiashii]|uniref:hypothetical protein n=1 Tax=Vibrio tubiashii TaxID=29498 RepID=UPI001EFE97BD|nr:hypothetical protein [Vibrio tubiashii]MCG9576067.1 hypothetical protein [Vibrio tubiashii]
MLGMLLFHGAKKRFERFDLAYLGTGETNPEMMGFYFSSSCYGAVRHSMNRIRADYDEAVLYVCRLKSEAIYVDRTRPIAELESKKSVSHWYYQLPVATSTLISSSDWFLKIRNVVATDHEALEEDRNRLALQYLRHHGIDVITNWEWGGWCDGYGSSTLVLNPDMIEILEVIPSKHLFAKKVITGESELFYSDHFGALGDAVTRLKVVNPEDSLSI